MNDPQSVKGVYAIDKGVPVVVRRCERVRKYPIRDMQVGDSFLVPTADIQRNLAQHVRNVAVAHGMKTAVRKTDDGVRVWRIA
jgi:hypothetical protein